MVKFTSKPDCKKGVLASVDSAITYQTFEEIGGAFSELGYQALLTAEKKDQDSVMGALFSAEGLGLHFCRFPVFHHGVRQPG